MDNNDSFPKIQGRLNEIVEIVSCKEIPLEEALALYEEAVNLGMQACDVCEQDLLENDAALESDVAEAVEVEAVTEESVLPVQPSGETVEEVEVFETEAPESTF